jgi:hypothetical protein
MTSDSKESRGMVLAIVTWHSGAVLEARVSGDFGEVRTGRSLFGFIMRRRRKAGVLPFYSRRRGGE